MIHSMIRSLLWWACGYLKLQIVEQMMSALCDCWTHLWMSSCLPHYCVCSFQLLPLPQILQSITKFPQPNLDHNHQIPSHTLTRHDGRGINHSDSTIFKWNEQCLVHTKSPPHWVVLPHRGYPDSILRSKVQDVARVVLGGRTWCPQKTYHIGCFYYTMTTKTWSQVLRCTLPPRVFLGGKISV